MAPSSGQSRSAQLAASRRASARTLASWAVNHSLKGVNVPAAANATLLRLGPCFFSDVHAHDDTWKRMHSQQAFMCGVSLLVQDRRNRTRSCWFVAVHSPVVHKTVTGSGMSAEG